MLIGRKSGIYSNKTRTIVKEKQYQQNEDF